ncbi:hypothetical protein TruAng_007254 [Truncatella angustata]|nr:hypothetical protein TruAng_007254 [Truncatella angustata]
MPQFTGWTIYSCSCNFKSFFNVDTLQEVDERYRRQYLGDYYRADDRTSFYAMAPRPCPQCIQAAAKGQSVNPHHDLETRWKAEWAARPAPLTNQETESLKHVLHHICPHFRAVGNLNEETVLKRVNSQLQLEGVNISEQTSSDDVNEETKQQVSQIVEEQLRTYRSTKHRRFTVVRESLLQEAEVAKRSSRSPKLVQLRPKRFVAV